MISNLAPSRVSVGPNVFLDGRLALFHRKQKWLAVADLHFGYELSQRAAGRLVPLWGMQSIEARLVELLDDYEPRRMIVVGDLVHDKTSAVMAAELLERLRARCEVVVVAGNHDRGVRSLGKCFECWESDGFFFHHGHCRLGKSPSIEIIGHHHPAATIRDGAGLHLKFPAFVQQQGCWILPAFSPWAAGTVWRADEESQVWLCTPRRVWRCDPRA